MADLTELTITEAAALIGAGEVSPVELTEAYLARIEEHDEHYNAYITVTADEARAGAALAEREVRSGIRRGPLQGIPIGLKDVIATRSIRTTCGSRILAEWIPDSDAHVVSLLREAGAVLLGKLNTHEFAAGATNENPHYGPVRNPWDTSRIAGGSSGGSAAAVAARLAAGAIGTDTGGSIRIPASFCGCVGLMPTFGRVSTTGVFPLNPSRDHVGPLARDTRDAALLLAAIEGYDPRDPNSARVPPAGMASEDRDLVGLRIAIADSDWLDILAPSVRAAWEAAARHLEQLGAELIPVPLHLPDDHGIVSAVLFALEAAPAHAAYTASRLEEYGDDLRSRFGLPAPGLADIARGREVMREIRRAVRQAVLATDALLLPTVPMSAPPIGRPTFESEGREFSVADIPHFTAALNSARVPVLTLPAGLTADRMPTSVSLVGNPFDEATLLRIGRALETLISPSLPEPPL